MYRIDDGGELADFSAVEDPSDLTAELAVARLVVQRSLEAGQYGLTLAALTVLAKLSVARDASLIRNSRHLDKAAVLAMGRAAAALLVELVGDLPRLTMQEKATFVDTFLTRFGEALETTRNSAKKQAKPLLLEHQK